MKCLLFRSNYDQNPIKVGLVSWKNSAKCDTIKFHSMGIIIVMAKKEIYQIIKYIRTYRAI